MPEKKETDESSVPKSSKGPLWSLLYRKETWIRLGILLLLMGLVYGGVYYYFSSPGGGTPSTAGTGGSHPLKTEPSPASGKELPADRSSQPDAIPVEHPPESRVEGARFIEAYIGVLEYELDERRFGWHPNSLLSGKLHLTDNVKNLQLGVLETVRVVGRVLKEKITRFGDADSFDARIENATNLFMISADQYWFPAADDEYRKGIRYLYLYLDDLKKGRAHFYPRSDNLEYLLRACKELIGNCHHNLVKQTELDGSHVSTFDADDYFYYAQGVAIAMGKILEATLYDFREELTLIKGENLLKEVVAALGRAARMNPWIILNGNLDGFLANHRANMAVPMGEALFKLSNVLTYGGGAGG